MGPTAVLTTLSCKGDHWIHSGSLSLTTVLTGNALCNTQTSPQRTFAQVEPSKPSGALQVLTNPSLRILCSIQVVNGDWFWQCKGFSSECFPGFFINEVLTCSSATCGTVESVISMCIAFVLPVYAVLASVALHILQFLGDLEGSQCLE